MSIAWEYASLKTRMRERTFPMNWYTVAAFDFWPPRRLPTPGLWAKREER